MLSLLYLDVEDFVSPPDHPSHRLPGEFARIMTKHNFGGGCFHIIGQKVRHMVQHAQEDDLKAIADHDVSLHYDRGSIHPTTAEETSNLSWHEAVSRVLFRERPGVDLLLDVFGKCSALTRHGWTWSASIAYAAGRMGLPFFNGPIRPPDHGVTWMCNNLDIRGLETELLLDQVYRDTPKFEQRLKQVLKNLDELTRRTDYSAMFGCHPSYTLYRDFADHNFYEGQNPKLADCGPPAEAGANVATVLRNFERYVVALKAAPNVTWTNVAGIRNLYRYRPVRVARRHLEEFARKVVERRGPTYTDVLTAAEGLVLLARARLALAESYEVPTVMGPLSAMRNPGESGSLRTTGGSVLSDDKALTDLSVGLIDYVYGTGFIPAYCELPGADIRIDPANLVVRLAFALLGSDAEAVGPLDIDEPTLLDGLDIPSKDVLEKWLPHGSQYAAQSVLDDLSDQAWTLKPAFKKDDYPDDVETAQYEMPMILTEWAEYDGHVVSY
ncbi:MAG: hypothetical protein SVV80_04105 [Planctomycetota bacterium]|nr:hypothetical protein [Planctomycetota bacterium]